MALISGCPFVVSFWSASRVWRIFFLTFVPPLQSFRLFVVIYCKFLLLWLFFFCFFRFYFCFDLCASENNKTRTSKLSASPTMPRIKPWTMPWTWDCWWPGQNAWCPYKWRFLISFSFSFWRRRRWRHAASVRSPFWAAWPGLNEKPYFSWCWPQFLTCDRLRLSGCCSSANLLLSALWAASLAAAWPDFVFRLGSKSHALAGSKKTQNRNQNRNPKCKGKTQKQIKSKSDSNSEYDSKCEKTVGDVCG